MQSIQISHRQDVDRVIDDRRTPGLADAPWSLDRISGLEGYTRGTREGEPQQPFVFSVCYVGRGGGDRIYQGAESKGTLRNVL